MSTLTWCLVDINRLVDDTEDLKENAMWYINHFPNTTWSYEDIQNAGFNVLDIVEGCMCDSCICEDDDGNVVIFAEKALNCWCSALVPIVKGSPAETWEFWEENFAESEEDDDYE